MANDHVRSSNKRQDAVKIRMAANQLKLVELVNQLMKKTASKFLHRMKPHCGNAPKKLNETTF